MNRAALLIERVNSVTGLSSKSPTNRNCAVLLIQTHTNLFSKCKKLLAIAAVRCHGRFLLAMKFLLRSLNKIKLKRALSVKLDSVAEK